MAGVKTWQMFIGGEWVDSSRGESEDDINPATGESVATVQVGTREDADRAVAAAQKAFDEVWFDTPPKERSAMMLKLADALDADADTLALLEAEDVGKPISVSAADIPFITDNIRFFAGAARVQEGKSTGEYERGFTSIDPPRAPRGHGGHLPVELPADDGGVEDRPGAGRREHLGHQAG